MRTAEPTIAVHFAGRDPAVRALYDRLLAHLRTLGPIVEEPKKTCIHLARRSALAGVRPRADGLELELKLDYEIDGPLVRKSEQISRSRWHHSIRLAPDAPLDGDVERWLADAHRLSG
jgi:hypothetical protein